MTDRRDVLVYLEDIVDAASKALAFVEGSAVPWRSMAGMRDKLIHHYSGVKLDVVWKTIRDDLPALQSQVQEVIFAVNQPPDSET